MCLALQRGFILLLGFSALSRPLGSLRAIPHFPYGLIILITPQQCPSLCTAGPAAVQGLSSGSLRFQGEQWNMLVSAAGGCCFVGYTGGKPHCVFLCSSCLPPRSFLCCPKGFSLFFPSVSLFPSPLFHSFHPVFNSSALFLFFTA